MRNLFKVLKKNFAFLVILSFTICASTYQSNLNTNVKYKNTFDRIILLEKTSLPRIVDKDIQRMLTYLKSDITNYNGNISVRDDVIVYEYDTYFNLRYKVADFNNIKRTNILNLNNEFIKSKIEDYNLFELKSYLGQKNMNKDSLFEFVNKNYKYYADNFSKMKDNNGQYIFNNDKPDYSYVILNKFLYMDLLLKSPERRIYITNTPILDDGFEIPIHTLIRGGMVNGICNDNSGSLIVSYFPLIYNSTIFNNNSSEFKEKMLFILSKLILQQVANGDNDINNKYNYRDKNSIFYPVYQFEYLDWLKNHDLVIH